jgi:hypothetical protein
MARQLQEGDTVNIYEQDFTDVKAYATTLAGQVFFGNVEGGAVLQAAGAYSEEDPTVYIGKLKSEEEGVIELSDALVLSPVQLKNGQRATNYSALDCLRALYNDVRTLAPEHLSAQSLRREQVLAEEHLENRL